MIFSGFREKLNKQKNRAKTKHFIVSIEPQQHRRLHMCHREKCDIGQMCMQKTLRALSAHFNWIKIKNYIKYSKLNGQRNLNDFHKSHVLCLVSACCMLDFPLFSFVFFVYSWQNGCRAEKHERKQTKNMFYTRNANTISNLSPFGDFSCVTTNFGCCHLGDLPGVTRNTIEWRMKKHQL